FNLPIVTLSPSMVWRWASVVAGSCSVNATGIVLALKLLKQPEQKLQETSFSTNPKVIVNRFFSRASPLAQKLVKLMAIVPIEMPIIQLLQQTLLPESKQEHIAEIFMSGLLQPHFEDIYQYENAYQYRVESDHFEQKNNVFTNNVSELRQYDFAPGVRGYLLDGISKSDARIVLETVSQYIARKLNRSTQNFVAFLSSTWADDEKQAVSRFAEVAESVLRRMGGEYAALVKKLETERFVESFQQPYKQPVSENKRWRALAWDDRPEDFLDSLSERLRQNKVDVVITNQVEDFDELFHDDYFWDFLILDILDGTSDPEYPSKAGIRLANRVRRSDPDIPIIFLTDDESIILSGEIIIPGPVLQMPKSYPRGMLTLDILDFAKKNLEPYDFSKVFVIYGHGKQANGLKDKVIHSLKEHGIDSVLISPENVMNSISEGLVDAMRSCGAFVAICTPDDQVADNWYQPRQNALLEIGIAMGLPNGFQRLVILQRAGAEPDKQAKLPSDLGGAFTLQFYDEHDEPIRRMINALENRKIKIQRPA
ncbi:MAG: TIR domain-containing protein, partial [Bacteroidota bacterium]